MEIYNYYKDLIVSNQLKAGDRLPSVRQASKLLPVSKTTIQNAYFELQADGYVISSPKSGYYVTEQSSAPLSKKTRSKPISNIKHHILELLLELGIWNPRTFFIWEIHYQLLYC